MISDKMQEALNKQINAELYSGYLYLAMSAYYQSQNLPGFANWMYIQMQEEQAHAQIIYNYLVARGGRVLLMSIDQPPAVWSDPAAPFQNAYEHEQKVTGLIYDLVSMAMEEKDYATNAMLQWFVNEQVEEEETALGIVEQLRMAGSAPAGLMMLDRELGARVFTPPAILAGGE